MSESSFGFSITGHFGIPPEALVQKAADAGFAAVSPTWSNDISGVCASASECGVQLQSMHAPISCAALMWSRIDEARESAVSQLLRALDDAARHSIPVVVMHTWIGFDFEPEPTDEGLEAHEALVRRAERHGIKIAYENTEAEQMLFALMEHFKGNDSVGFCWDSGHELCYNRGRDLLSELGDRLIMTHINDNLGISDKTGKIYYTDDLHLLPFDGVVDLDRAANNLKEAKKQDFINLELKLYGNEVSKKKYGGLSVDEYLREAYARITRFSAMIV